MTRLLVSALCLMVAHVAFCQDDPFPFGKPTLRELSMTVYEKDTSAQVLVLKEFGKAYIETGDNIRLVFQYHVKIKILGQKGLDEGSVTIPLYKKGMDVETIRSLKASTFNIEDGMIRESPLTNKQMFTESYDKNWSIRKFALPNVRVGSVIEYEYELETPFFYQNFREWNFQSEYPKLESEYWATIPANWRYNISLRGYLPLKKNESEIVRDCFSIGSGKADCVRYRWSMENIPALYEEEYMTAKKNFLASINFELMQLEYFDGRKDKVSKEWKDVEQELRQWEKFGLQLKRGRDVVDTKIEAVIASEADTLQRAKKIFEFIKQWYEWNDNYGYYSESGIKKAFESRKGNIGDINISLIAALRYGGLNVEPMLLSTRENGVPRDLFPVLTDFNYVVAKLNINNKVYLLDASTDFLPFGILPVKCLNGKGRVLGERESYWYDLTPVSRAKVYAQINLALKADGNISGKIRRTFYGYRAADIRKLIYSYSNRDEYKADIKGTAAMEIGELTFTDIDNFDKPLTEEYTFEMEGPLSGDVKSGFMSPMIIEKWTKNPFRSSERSYPVDFGVPLDEVISVTMELPAGVTVADLPPRKAVALPNSGGRFLFESQATGQKIMMTSSLQINRTIFDSSDYFSLKEFFSVIVKTQGEDLVLERN